MLSETMNIILGRCQVTSDNAINAIWALSLDPQELCNPGSALVPLKISSLQTTKRTVQPLFIPKTCEIGLNRTQMHLTPTK